MVNFFGLWLWGHISTTSTLYLFMLYYGIEFSIFFYRYIRLLSNVLEWQQTNTQVNIKCEDLHTINRYHPFSSNHMARNRARLRRNVLISHSLPMCDRNGNNLLMIAPNNHLPLRRHLGGNEIQRYRREEEGVKNEKDDTTEKEVEKTNKEEK